MLLVINQSLKLFEKLEGSFEANGSGTVGVVSISDSTTEWPKIWIDDRGTLSHLENYF
jgi:hypothetical protein